MDSASLAFAPAVALSSSAFLSSGTCMNAQSRQLRQLRLSRNVNPLFVPPMTPCKPSRTCIHASTANVNNRSMGRVLRLPSLPSSVSGRFLLTLVPILWASYGILVKAIYILPWSLHITVFNTSRLFLASLLSLPSLIPFLRRTPRKTIRSVVSAGFELGFWTLCINVLQIVGLKFISASRAAFLTQLSTVLVPFVAFLSGLEPRIAPSLWSASFVSVLGVALLSLDGPSSSCSLFGDGLLVLSAFAAAIYVLRSKRHANKCAPEPLVALKVTGQFLFSIIFAVCLHFKDLTTMPILSLVKSSFVGFTWPLLLLNVGFILWAAFLSTSSTLLQFKGQKMVSASEAAIIFTSTPLWSAAMAIPLGERFGMKGIVGAMLITFATFMASGKNEEQAASSAPSSNIGPSSSPNKVSRPQNT